MIPSTSSISLTLENIYVYTETQLSLTGLLDWRMSYSDGQLQSPAEHY